MFENTSNNSSNQPVDDIFAETDKTSNNNPAYDQSGIVTRKVGLSSGELAPDPEIKEEQKSKKGFLITVIIMAVIVVGLLAFLAYNKFLKPETEPENALLQVPIQQNTEDEDIVANTSDDETVGFDNLLDENVDLSEDNLLNPEDVFVDPEEPLTEEPLIEEPQAIDSDGDGLSDDQEEIYTTNINLIDTDNDGLTDYEEVMVYGTNPNQADSDSDGLSDYEETKIYNTDPLISDTDSDGYSDGEEVKNGYNPRGQGLLPGNENRE